MIRCKGIPLPGKACYFSAPKRFEIMTMKFAVAILALNIAGFAQAGLYKCSKNGEISYQEMPCDKSSAAIQTAVAGDSPFIGCYKANYPAEPYELFEVRRVIEERRAERLYYNDYTARRKSEPVLRLMRVDKPDWEGLVLKNAGDAELQHIASVNHLSLKRGVTSSGYDGDQSYYRRRRDSALGIYEAKDGAVHIVYESRSSPAKKVACN
ncbi:hypothetical protein [Chitinimonas sp.]|uniref:hypothetical protein n=1 Tax=Chitinimonas sp. TaxID=1934313 RepID=UPI0035B0CEAF